MQEQVVVDGKAGNHYLVTIGESVCIVVVNGEHHDVIACRMREHDTARVNGNIKRRIV